MTREIKESEMRFKVHDKYFFYIEKSEIYEKNKQGVKSAEFVMLRSSQNKKILWVVEAKANTPKDYDEFIKDIRQKFIDTFSLLWAVILKRHPKAWEELPESFKNLDLSQTEVRFILVVKEAREEWLAGLQDALVNELRPTAKVWRLGSSWCVVLNEAGARKARLIV